MNDTCTCGETFRTPEDFRDHMPCPGSAGEQLKEFLRRADEAIKEMRTVYAQNRHAQEWADFFEEHLKGSKTASTTELTDCVAFSGGHCSTGSPCAYCKKMMEKRA